MNPEANDPSTPAASSGRKILVWDLPTRGFHWLLVLLVTTSFITGKVGGLWMSYHLLSGYAILGLILFRLIWGVAGGRYARFSSFLRGPAAVLRYLRDLPRRDAPHYPGHNPLGGWSVAAMLLTLLIQAVSGLFASDDIFTEGPLYSWVSESTSAWLTRLHLLNQEIILVLVGVHVLAVLFYLIVKHDNLIGPMFSGMKHPADGALPSANPVGRGALIAGLAAAAVYLLVR